MTRRPYRRSPIIRRIERQACTRLVVNICGAVLAAGATVAAIIAALSF